VRCGIATEMFKTFAGRVVVDDVSFTVRQGRGAWASGGLGRNGAGKTTSFRMTIGMIDADWRPPERRARPRAEGRSSTARTSHGCPMYKRAREGMGYLSQEPSVFGRLSCEDNLLAILETLPMTRKERKETGPAIS
jgi:lipopolysaccharide export system ATP-binding protein